MISVKDPLAKEVYGAAKYTKQLRINSLLSGDDIVDVGHLVAHLQETAVESTAKLKH